MTKQTSSPQTNGGRASHPRMGTGIEGLDNILGGGFPAYRVYLI